MRNILVGFAVVGLLAVRVGAPAVAHTMSAPMAVVRPNAVQRADWDNCGPRCRDYRAARELERQRWAQHHRWKEHHRWEESNRYTSSAPYSYQHR
jgi:hypothetical protein